MILNILCAATIAAFGWLFYEGFRPRVALRNTQRPFLVVKVRLLGQLFLLDASYECTVCGWRLKDTEDHWKAAIQYNRLDEYGVVRFLGTHQCPTVEEAAQPSEWE